MKKNIKQFLISIENKVPYHSEITKDLDILSNKLKCYNINLYPKSITKLLNYLSTKDKPSKQVLNRLALFAGFQNWHDLQETIHGDSDGLINYENIESNSCKKKNKEKLK